MMKNFIWILVVAYTVVSGSAQTIFEQGFESQSLDQVVIQHFAGEVNVHATSGDQVNVKAELVKGTLAQQVTIDYLIRDKYLLVYLRTPCTKREQEIDFDPNDPGRMQYWHEDCEWLGGEEQMPVINISVHMPSHLNIFASTILAGDVIIEQMEKSVWASNVNGSVMIKDVNHIREAKTVNGDIDIKYRFTPNSEASFSTINGDIKIEVDPSLNATTSFKSFSGDFFTNFSRVEVMPGTSVAKTNTNGFKYRLESRKSIAINGGGPRMDFETFNGNVYLTSTK